ncbi:MAG: hypothetical protein L0Z54_05185 [Thermoplasmata archaeon]|nr:hypothetical protein [Thermoplasmata archaeon]
MLTRTVKRHYLRPLGRARDRKGCWVFPREIVGSGEWLDGLWSRRDAIGDKPALMLWGMRDIAFRERELERWSGLFTDGTVVRFEETGHFVQEEKGADLCAMIEDLLARNR